MPFDSIWLLLPVALIFSGWMMYEHRRISGKADHIATEAALNQAAESYRGMVKGEHHGAGHVPRMKGVTVQTIDGKNWRTSQCVECGALEVHEQG